MQSATGATSPVLDRPHVFSVGPSWWGLGICAAVIGAMLPWLMADESVELSLPWLGVRTLPPGMPLWVAISAGVFGLMFSIRSKVFIDESARTITRWRCVGVLIPWSIKTRSFHEVRFVRFQVHSGMLSGILNVLMSLPGEHGDPPDPSPVKLGAFLVQIVFDDRDWFNVAKCGKREAVALGQELCDILGTRRG